MSRIQRLSIIALLATLIVSCGGKQILPDDAIVGRSPDGALEMAPALSLKSL